MSSIATPRATATPSVDVLHFRPGRIPTNQPSGDVAGCACQGCCVDIADICEAFGLGAPTGPPSYVARGELGRVSRLPTAAGVWAVKEIEPFVPTTAEADANVALQESMLDAGVNLPRPRRTVDGHGLLGSVRVYEWLDMTPVAVGDPDVEDLSPRPSLACTCMRR